MWATTWAMASDNVEITRRFFEMAGAADTEAVAAAEEELRELAAERTTEDFEWINAETGQPLRDFDAILASHHDWIEPWEDVHQELEELVEAGDSVVAVVRLWGRAKQSGLEAEMHTHFVFTFRQGKVARVVEYLDRDEALAAAG